jgi:hypothetical protein
MTAWKVGKAVGNVKNDTPDLIEPASTSDNSIENQETDGPGSLFT